jgi:hypothetical protein
MALFGGARDISLFRNLNRELLGDIITQQIAYYKYDYGKNKVNIYGEAIDKYFFTPVLLNCLIQRNDQIWGSSDLGPNITRTMTFNLFRDDLKDAQVVPEVGDIVMWYESFFELDNIQENQLFSGKSEEYPYSPNPLNPGLENFGSSISIICQGQLIPSDKYSLTKARI